MNRFNVTTKRYVRGVSRLSKTGLSDAFVELADTLVEDFDVIDFLHLLAARCTELLDVGAAGLLFVDHNGRLRVLAASSEQARLLELFELQNEQGPCLHSFRTGLPVSVPDLRDGTANTRWPQFAAAALEAGYAAVHALPMRLRDQVIGALNLFDAEPGDLAPEDREVGQALVNVATIGLLQYRTTRRHEVLAEQLQVALHSRVVIEQAKGVLAERLGLDMDRAFEAMRRYARSNSTPLDDVARGVTDRTLDLGALR